jgi:hypothetical protein
MKNDNKPAVPAKKTVISDLISEDFTPQFAKLDELKVVLNHEPLKDWVKEHPYIRGHSYLPIDKVEWLLDKLFKRYRIEVIKTGMLMNAIEVTVRLHYYNPVTQEWDFHDGVGAQELQTTKDSGSLKLDMSNVNRGAVSMALPIAKTYAIKDAADHIGRIFGRDLNRKDTVKFGADAMLQEKAERYAMFVSESNSEPIKD